MDMKIRAMKGDSTFFRAPELGSHYQIQFYVIHWGHLFRRKILISLQVIHFAFSKPRRQCTIRQKPFVCKKRKSSISSDLDNKTNDWRYFSQPDLFLVLVTNASHSDVSDHIVLNLSPTVNASRNSSWWLFFQRRLMRLDVSGRPVFSEYIRAGLPGLWVKGQTAISERRQWNNFYCFRQCKRPDLVCW